MLRLQMMLPNLLGRSASPDVPYDSRLLRFRSPSPPQTIRDRFLSCLSQSLSSSSTPTATFSGSDLLYQGDGVHRSHGDDLAASTELPAYDRDRQRLKDLEVGNRRPTSRNKKMSVVDKVSFDRERDDLRVLNNSIPSKPPTLRNGGPRNSLVRGEQMITGRNGTANTNRESDELIAMGTIWSPASTNNVNNNNTTNNNSTINNSTISNSSTIPTRSSSNTTNSNKSTTLNNNTTSTTNGYPQRKPGSLSVATSLNNNTSRTGHCNTGGNSNSRTQKDSKDEPKYSDPLAGAPASFQQRLMDLASLEAETIRWERTKKVKKKKQDRDS